MKMKNMFYYVVEVAFRKNNPIHRAVCFHRSNGNVELFGSYEGVLTKHISHFAYFRVVEEIPSMNTNDYPNRFKLPGDAVEKGDERGEQTCNEN